ncbi:hypothetical protein PR048_000676 [Dryococelus australis]|uniref:Uncharacterized protein n=1 Tax=Dryococelus australis TaxID=614101 RepID=A0ABQ9IGI4_9NEOP|nr:hypothetical protein PR048_000676 [Dryococelus australis]
MHMNNNAQSHSPCHSRRKAQNGGPSSLLLPSREKGRESRGAPGLEGGPTSGVLVQEVLQVAVQLRGRVQRAWHVRVPEHQPRAPVSHHRRLQQHPAHCSRHYTNVSGALISRIPLHVVRTKLTPKARRFACGNRAGRCRSWAAFLGHLQFPPPFHSGAVSYSPSFNLVGSPDLDGIYLSAVKWMDVVCEFMDDIDMFRLDIGDFPPPPPSPTNTRAMSQRRGQDGDIVFGFFLGATNSAQILLSLWKMCRSLSRSQAELCRWFFPITACGFATSRMYEFRWLQMLQGLHAVEYRRRASLRTAFDSQRVHYRILACKNRAGRCRWISRSPCPYLPALFNNHLASPSLDLTTSMLLRAAQNPPLHS